MLTRRLLPGTAATLAAPAIVRAQGTPPIRVGELSRADLHTALSQRPDHGDRRHQRRRRREKGHAVWSGTMAELQADAAAHARYLAV